MSVIPILSINGMDHFNDGVSDGVAIPYDIVDATFHAGRLEKRAGSKEVIPLVDGSNLWKSKGTNLVYCVSNGHLCIVNFKTMTTTTIFAINHPEHKVYFVNNETIDYIGNKFWNVAVDDGVVRNWGQSIDEMDAMDWETTENGLVLYLIDSDGEQKIIPHPGEFVHPPSLMDGLTLAHGRIWGFVNKLLLYSNAHVYEWFEDYKNNFEFDSVVTMYAPISGGAFIGTEKETIFLSGTDPQSEQMGQSIKQYIGVQKDSLVYAPNISKLPSETPTWLNNEGFVVAGMPDGSIIELTKDRVKTEPHSDCRGGVLNIDGVQTLLYRIKGE